MTVWSHYVVENKFIPQTSTGICFISMCNQMVTSEIRDNFTRVLGFGQNASEIIP